MDSPTVELMTALASYPVHRALLASRSDFFEGVCRNPFQESGTGVIDLTEDDPEAVEHMVHYFYHLDYLKKPLSRRSSQKSTQPKLPMMQQSPERRPKKLNLALIEDPLLAMVSASSPLTPPPEQHVPRFTTLDASAKIPVTPSPEESIENPFENLPGESPTEIEKPHLIIHAKVYAIAEKYGISGLKSLAKKKFAHQIERHISSAELPEACQEVYESTIDTDRGLRDVVVQTFRSNPDLTLRKDVELAVRETPGLAFELFRMASGLPVTS